MGCRVNEDPSPRSHMYLICREGINSKGMKESSFSWIAIKDWPCLELTLSWIDPVLKRKRHRHYCGKWLVWLGAQLTLCSTTHLWIFQDVKTGSCNIFLYLLLIIFQNGVYRTMVFHVEFVTLQELVRNGGQQPQEKGTHGPSRKTSSKYDLFQNQG